MAQKQAKMTIYRCPVLNFSGFFTCRGILPIPDHPKGRHAVDPLENHGKIIGVIVPADYRRPGHRHPAPPQKLFRI